VISLVTTVFNDWKGVQLFFERIAAQTRKPDEIIIVDAFSKDGTWDILQAEARRKDRPWKMVTWQERCNVARGRNLAIRASSNGIIASTDIGCDWEPEWLDELVTPLLLQPEVEVVIGSWACPKSWATTEWAKTEYAIRPSMKLEALPNSQGVSRSIAYRKTAWEKVGGYPEDLTLAADDTCFDFLTKKQQLTRASAPRIRCYWHRHNELKDFLKEERRNFFGDGEAAFRHRHFMLVGGRLLIELLGLILGVVSLLWLKSALIGFTLLLCAITSISMRVRRWHDAVQQLREEEVSYPWVRVILFEYLSRIHGLFGYARGYLHGLRHCRDIRAKLHGS
jgi:glycosyltransferase involved in cell wall biosynthesis